MTKTNDGRLYIISGASRSGKTVKTVRMVGASRRVLAWDPEAQWCELRGFRKVTTRAALLEAVKKGGDMRIAFVRGGNLKEEFDFFCACCMFLALHRAGGYHIVAEELADVTTSSKAPNHWGILLRRSLKRGMTIYAISQRWAEADKTAMGNATVYVLFASRGEDINYISRKTLVPVDELAGLRALEYIMYDPVTKEKSKNRLTFRTGRA